jgi:hypothetical protein
MRNSLTVLGLLQVAIIIANVTAHMQLNSPPPFRAANNPHTLGTPDDEILFPYNCCGKKTPMPCRGYLSLLGTPEGASVATWKAGSQQTWSLSGPGKNFHFFSVALFGYGTN